MKRMLVQFVEKVHKKLFGHEISQEMKNFIVNLFWSFFGGGVAAVIVLAVNIFAGRLMGPSEYGRYNLVLVICSYLFIPIFFGLDTASVRAIARAKDLKERSEYISGAALFISLSLVVVLIAAFLFEKSLSSLFSTDVSLVRFSLLFAIFLTLKMAFDGFIRGIQEFKYQFASRLVETFAIIVMFLALFVFLKRSTYISYIYVLATGAIALSCLYLWKLKPYLGYFRLDKLKEQLSHGKFFMLTAALATVFMSFDKLVINRYSSSFQLGLYGAYYTASITLVAQLTSMFNNVFFPAIAKNLNKAVFAKIEKLLFISFVPLLVVITGIVFLIVKLYGAKYGVHFNYILIFGFLGTIQVVQTIYNSIINTLPQKTYKQYILLYNVVNAVTILAYIGFIVTNRILIQNIAIALAANYAILTLLQRKLIKDNF